MNRKIALAVAAVITSIGCLAISVLYDTLAYMAGYSQGALLLTPCRGPMIVASILAIVVSCAVTIALVVRVPKP